MLSIQWHAYCCTTTSLVNYFFFFFFFFFHWHYSPLWALACRTMSFHFFLSAPPTLSIFSLPALEDLFLLPLSIFFLDLPLLLVPSSSWVNIFWGILSSSILSRWPNQFILCPFVHFPIFSPLFISSITGKQIWYIFYIYTVHLVQFIIQNNKCTTYTYIYKQYFIYREHSYMIHCICIIFRDC